MQVTMLKAKIHRATVTQAELHYVGSITIDEALLRESGIYEYERVQVVDVDNGERLETYAIAGEAGSGIICLNGAAARKVCVGDTVIIMAYAQMEEKEAAAYRPKVLLMGKGNQVKAVYHYEEHGTIIEEN